MKSPIYLKSLVALGALTSCVTFAQAEQYTQSESPIALGNVSTLEPIWTYRSGVSANFDTVQTSPQYFKDKFYTVDLSGNVIAIEPETGREVWKTRLAPPAGRRGFTVNASQDSYKDGLFVPFRNGVAQIDAKTGSVQREFVSGTSLVAPLINGNTIYIATLDKGIKAYDLETGALKWTRPLVGGGVVPRVWSGIALSAKLGIIFVNTSNPDTIVGVGRTGDDHSSSVLALDENDGSIRWKHKHINNDLWDFDVVGTPMVVDDVVIQGRRHDAVVVSLSKTGDVLVFDAATGETVYENQINQISVPASDVPGVQAAKMQNVYNLPKNLSGIVINPEADFRFNDGKNGAYINTKLRNAKFGAFLPPSLNYDAVTFGVHGGAEWTGGAVTFANGEPSVIVPTNRYPWILRIFYEDVSYKSLRSFIRKYFQPVVTWLREGIGNAIEVINRLFGTKIELAKDFMTQSRTDSLSRWDPNNWFYEGWDVRFTDSIYRFLPWMPSHSIYEDKCASCHGAARQGNFQSELSGDGFIPPLVAIHRSKKWEKVDTVAKLVAIHGAVGSKLDLSENEYATMMRFYASEDEKLFDAKRLRLTGFWQILLDENSMPVTRAPWGQLSSINLQTGKLNWQAPFGGRNLSTDDGDMNFGGVSPTDTGLIFATGTPRAAVYAYDSSTGQKVWEHALPHSGSAPPRVVRHKGCDLLVVTATGGRFVGFGPNGDATVAFKTKDCNFSAAAH